MQVLYAYSANPRPLKIWRDVDRNTHELGRDEAMAAARRIARDGGYARVVFGQQTLLECGSDPRSI